MDKDVFKDWTLGDYLLKAGPPKPLIPRVGNNDKRVIKGRPLHVAPPAHRQPLRIFLAPDLEPFKYEAYKDLVYAAAARSGVELQGPRTSLNFMASFEMRGLGISESIECVVVSPVHTIAIVALGFAHEIASDFAPAPDFASPESSRRNWWPSFDGLVEEGDFNIGLMTSDRSVRGEEWNMVAPIEVLTMFAADRSFAKLEEEIAAGGEDGVRILDITGAGRELLYRAILSCFASPTTHHAYITDATRWICIYLHLLTPATPADPHPPFVLFVSPVQAFEAREPSFITSLAYTHLIGGGTITLPASWTSRIQQSLSSSRSQATRVPSASEIRKAYRGHPRLVNGLDSLRGVDSFSIFFDDSPFSPHSPSDDELDLCLHTVHRIPPISNSINYHNHCYRAPPDFQPTAEPLSVPLLRVPRLPPLSPSHERHTTHFTALLPSSPERHTRLALRYSKRWHKDGASVKNEAYIYENYLQAAWERGAGVPRYGGLWRGGLFYEDGRIMLLLEWPGLRNLESWDELEGWQKLDLYKTVRILHHGKRGIKHGHIRPRYVYLDENDRPILTHFVNSGKHWGGECTTDCEELRELRENLGVLADGVLKESSS